MDEAILVEQSQVTEGANSNLFLVKNGCLMTPPLSDQLLGGVTRELVLDIAGAAAIPLKITPITLEELYHADEVWLTGSSREITPVIKIDGKAINAGQVGPLWYKMIQLYRQHRDNLLANHD